MSEEGSIFLKYTITTLKLQFAITIRPQNSHKLRQVIQIGKPDDWNMQKQRHFKWFDIATWMGKTLGKLH